MMILIILITLWFSIPSHFIIQSKHVDFVLVPHIAGIVTKNVNAGLTKAEVEARDAQREKDRLSDLSISAFERGLKKRKRKKNKKSKAEDEEVASN